MNNKKEMPFVELQSEMLNQIKANGGKEYKKGFEDCFHQVMNLIDSLMPMEQERFREARINSVIQEKGFATEKEIHDWLISESKFEHLKVFDIRKRSEEINSALWVIEMTQKYMGWVRKNYDHIQIYPLLIKAGIDDQSAHGIHKLLFYHIDSAETWNPVTGIIKEYGIALRNFKVTEP